MIVRNNSQKQEVVFKSSDKDVCPQNGRSHGPLIIDSIRGEILCASCGIVIKDRIEDQGPEQRSFNQEQYNERARTGLGSTLSLHDKGLSTIIGAGDKDASGNSISSAMKFTFNRLRTWDSRSKVNALDRNLKTAFVIMEAIQSKLDLSDGIIERAAYLYRKALTKKITRGRTISGMILSALYVACRESNVPRSLQDIATVGNVSFKDLSRHYRILVKTLELQIDSYNSSEFVSRIGTGVGLSEKAKRDALNILIKAKEKGITAGKNPISLAAAAIFLSGIINKEVATQKNIAAASGISSVTIRNVAKIIKKNL
jgi:transcription initiation factor TFIIB